VREADILLHIVDISHPYFEEQIDVVHQTLMEIGAKDKPIYLVFNKIDAYRNVPRDEDDLTPVKRENLSLEELGNLWIAKNNDPCIFISAKQKTNIEEFRNLLYARVKEIHQTRYPYDNLLY
jgi:GTP-binding protein HflX